MDEQDLMNISQVCGYLNLTAIKVTQLVELDLIPTVKVGNEVKFSRRGLDAWMESRPNRKDLNHAPEE